jgi:hypothetical protein
MRLPLVEKSSLTRTVADAAASRAVKNEIRSIAVQKLTRIDLS